MLRGSFLTVPSPIRWTAANIAGRDVGVITLLSDPSPGANKAKRALYKWRNQYPLPTESDWVMDAALQAIAWADLYNETTLFWMCTPEASLRPTRAVPCIVSSFESERAIVNWAKRTWHAYWKEFRRATKLKPNSRRDAEWLARHLKGDSYAMIAQDDLRSGNDVGTIKTACNRIASACGFIIVGETVGNRAAKSR